MIIRQYQPSDCNESITLIYPFAKNPADKVIEFHSQDCVTVRVKFVDLFDVKNSLFEIVEMFRLDCDIGIEKDDE